MTWPILSQKCRGFSRLLSLNTFTKQTLNSTNISSFLEPRHPHRTNEKRPDGLTLDPWPFGCQLLDDVTVDDSLAPNKLSAGSVCSPGMAAAEADVRIFDNTVILFMMDIFFKHQLLKFRVPLALVFRFFRINFVGKLCMCTEEPSIGSFFEQRNSLALQLSKNFVL